METDRGRQLGHINLNLSLYNNNINTNSNNGVNSQVSFCSPDREVNNCFVVGESSTGGSIHLPSRTLVGGSPAARRFLGLQFLKKESEQKRSKREQPKNLLSKDSSSDFPSSVRSPTASPGAKSNVSKDLILSAESRCEVMPFSQAFESITNMKHAALSTGFDSKFDNTSGKCFGYSSKCENGEKGSECISDETISHLLLKRLELISVLPDKSTISAMSGFHESKEINPLFESTLALMANMRKRILIASDRWNQLTAELCPSVQNTTKPSSNKKNYPIPPKQKRSEDARSNLESEIVATIDLLRVRSGVNQSFVANDNYTEPGEMGDGFKAAFRAAGILFPLGVESKSLVARCISEVATDICAMIADETAMRNQIVKELLPIAREAQEENVHLRRLFAVALKHINQTQVVQKVLGTERKNVLALLTSYESSCSREYENLRAVCDLAMGAIDASTNAINQTSSVLDTIKNHLHTAGVPLNAPEEILRDMLSLESNLPSLIRTLVEVRSKVAGVKNDQTDLFKKESQALSERFLKSTVNSQTLEERVNKLHESLRNMPILSTSNKEDLETNKKVNAVLSRALKSLNSPDSVPELPPEEFPPSSSTENLSEGNVSSINLTVSPVSLRESLSVHNKDQKGIESSSEVLLSDALVGALRSQIDSMQSTINSLSLQLHEMRSNESQQKTEAALKINEAFSEIERHKEARDILLRERSFFLDALLLSFQNRLERSRINPVDTSKIRCPNLPSRYTHHQLAVISSALSSIHKLNDFTTIERLKYFKMWQSFLLTKKVSKLELLIVDKKHVFLPSSDGTPAQLYSKPFETVSQSLNSFVGTTGTTAELAVPSGTFDWSREKEQAELVSRVATQQSLLINLSKERDDLLAQNILLKRRLLGDENCFTDTNSFFSKNSKIQNLPLSQCHPLIGPDKLKELIEENKQNLSNPNLRNESNHSLQTRGTCSSFLVANASAEDPANRFSDTNRNEEISTERTGGGQPTKHQTKSHLNQVILRNSPGAGSISAKIVTDAVSNLRNGNIVYSERLNEATLKLSNRTTSNVKEFSTSHLLPALPGTPGSPKRNNNHFMPVGSTSGLSPQKVASGVVSSCEPPHSLSNCLPHGRVTTDTLEQKFPQEIAERLLEIVTDSGSGRTLPNEKQNVSQFEKENVKESNNIRLGVFNAKTDFQRVFDEVDRNLATRNAVDSGVSATAESIQLSSLRVYATLHPILRGVLKRLRVLNVRIQPLPLYEATTQPIVAIVLSWIESNFSRLLYLLTCEDRLLKVKWRMTFLGIQLRSRISASETDVKHVRADATTVNFLKLQLNEYWKILKGVTSCRQHAEALRKGLQTAHMGSTPEKQKEVQTEMLSVITAVEDEAEEYMRRTFANTFKARQQDMIGNAGDNKLHPETMALESKQRNLRDLIENEATKRNARSAWADVVFSHPRVSTSTRPRSNTKSDRERKNQCFQKTDCESSSSFPKEKKLSTGYTIDLTNADRDGEVTYQQPSQSPLVQPSFSSSAVASPISSLQTKSLHTQDQFSQKSVSPKATPSNTILTELRKLQASALPYSKVSSGQCGDASPLINPTCRINKLSPLKKMRHDRSLSAPQSKLPNSYPVNNKIQNSPCKVNPSYVSRIVAQYDQFVMPNCFPDFIDKSSNSKGPFSSYSSEKGRVVVDSSSLSTETPNEAVTRRLL